MGIAFHDRPCWQAVQSSRRRRRMKMFFLPNQWFDGWVSSLFHVPHELFGVRRVLPPFLLACVWLLPTWFAWRPFVFLLTGQLFCFWFFSAALSLARTFPSVDASHINAGSTVFSGVSVSCPCGIWCWFWGKVSRSVPVSELAAFFLGGAIEGLLAEPKPRWAPLLVTEWLDRRSRLPKQKI